MENHRQGIYRYFITDDNSARNRNWEPLFDRMIEVQRREGFQLHLILQVDMLCHRIKGFIDEAAEAGTEHIFCGLKSINPDNLRIPMKAASDSDGKRPAVPIQNGQFGRRPNLAS